MTLIKNQRPLGLLSDFFFDTPFIAAMKADVKETEGAYVVEAELPGAKKENIEIICEQGVLTITAKTAEENNEEKAQYIRRERTSAELTRRFEISGIDEESISAKFTDGILSVTLPKKAPVKNEKHIAIE